MLLPRSSAALRAAPRAVPAAAPRLAAAAVPRRGMVTAAERWNEEDWHNAHALVKDNSISLDKNIRDIESKWKHMSKPEQIGTWVLLEDIMKKDWNELTFTEKRAAYFISYGPYGPRKETPPGFHTKVALGTLAGIIAAIAFTTSIQRLGGAKNRPATWSPEWQEAMNEKAREQKNDPITGVAAEDYKGSGFRVRYPL